MDLNKVDFDKINSLTADEIIIANILDKAAREAEAEKMEKAEKSKSRKKQSKKNSITNESKEFTVNRKEEEIENEEIVKE